MKKTALCMMLSLFAVASAVQAGDDKAPAPKPTASTDEDAKSKAPQPAVAKTSDTDCCCSDTCSAPARKVAMSPKAAALAANK